MIPHHSSRCTETLLDVICYEAIRERLSPEMEALLVDHLAECEHCRMRVLGMRQLLEKGFGDESLSLIFHPHCAKNS
jgi:hypothetical protein